MSTPNKENPDSPDRDDIHFNKFFAVF